MSSSKLSRRSFLQGAAAMATMPDVSAFGKEAEAVGSMLSAMGPKSKFVQNGIVNTAAHWGGVSVTVENGKIVKSTSVFANRMYNSLQDYTEDLVYAEDRIRYPMVRKSFLDNPDNPKPELRGSDAWVRVSWEKAIKLAGRQIKKAYAEKGPSSIYAGSPGWSSSGNLHRAEKLVQRFFRCAGGFTNISGNYSVGASVFITPRVTGKIDVLAAHTTWDSIYENSELVVIWGANPLSTMKVSFNCDDNLLPEYWRKLKETGKRVIIIDPVYSETCQYFEVQEENWIRPRPNSDSALMLAMCHTLYTEKKHNQEFLDNYTDGFDVFKDYFMGKNDGIVKDAQWAEKLTDIPADVIKKLALECAAKRSMLMMGWSPQRQQHGEQRHWGIITLATMIGQIGLPGGGFGLGYHQGGTGVPETNHAKLGAIGVKSRLEKKEPQMFDIPVARISDVLLNPGKTIDYNGKKTTYPTIDLIYWGGGNPYNHHQDINTLFKAWTKVKTVIINEMYWTSTARMADIVFPAATPYERNDIVQGGDLSNKYIYPIKAVVPPQYESKSDYDMFILLAKELGGDVEMLFTENKTEMDWISEFYEAARTDGQKKGLQLPAFRKFWDDNQPLTFQATEKARKFVSYADFREDPLMNPLGTESGKFQLFSKKIAAYNYDDCPGHFSWLEPTEWLGNVKSSAKFALVSPHPNGRLHSQLGNTSLRHTFEIQGREPIWINSEDAKAKGIEDGDVVRVFNERGQTLAGAFVSDKIKPGVVRMQEGAWYDPLDRRDPKTLCKHGNVNVLTLDVPTSKLSVATTAGTTMVDFEKYAGKIPEISIFKQPKTVSK